MIRMKDLDLQATCANYAAKYTNSKMRNAPLVEMNLTMNCAAHGFWMGVRFMEARHDRWLLPKGEVNEKKALREGSKAASYYIKNRLQGLSPEQEAIVRIALAKAFVEGLKYREEQLTS